MLRLFLTFISILYLLSAQGCKEKSYIIPYYNATIEIDGKSTDASWSKCREYIDFISPWDDSSDQGTQFKSFYNDEYFYFHFRVKDLNVICHEHEENDLAVEYSDRVELFFFIDSLSHQYCGLEFDACGRKMQFYANGYRSFMADWKFPELGAEDHAVSITEYGYEVEGRMSLKVMKELGIIKHNNLTLGVFRADCLDPLEKTKIRWISWKSINTASPDFHTTEGFKKVYLELSIPKS